VLAQQVIMGRAYVGLGAASALHAVCLWFVTCAVEAQTPYDPAPLDPDTVDSPYGEPSPADYPITVDPETRAAPPQLPAAQATAAARTPPPTAAAIRHTVAVDPGEGGNWGQTRALGEHNFQLSSFVPSALIDSHLGIRAGVEYHQVPGFAQLPSLVSSGPQAVDLRTINVAETLDFAIRLHDHFAIYGDGYGKARVGANTATLLGTGADYTYGGDLGLLVKLFRAGSFQLSVRGQAGYYDGQSAGILALFQDLSMIAQDAVLKVQRNPVLDLNQAIDQLNNAFRTATSDLLTPFSGFSYGFALNAAQAVGRYFGLQASLGYYVDNATYRPTRYDTATGGPVTREQTIKTTRPSLGLAIDVDASPAGLPFAMLLEYRATPINVNSQEDANYDLTSFEHLVALGLFYSGRRDLQLGFTGYTLFGQPPAIGANAIPSGKPLDLALQLVFRYFW
jgi:hypothetical protein